MDRLHIERFKGQILLGTAFDLLSGEKWKAAELFDRYIDLGDVDAGYLEFMRSKAFFD